MPISFVARGVIVPILSHFTKGGATLDEAAMRDHVAWLLDRGIHGLMTCGSTGEVALLSGDERKALLETVMEQTRHRVPVMAHVGAVTTRETLDLAQHARACEVEAISVVTPYFYRLSDQELLAHFCRVADSVPEVPVFLYNIPRNTGNAISRDLVVQVLQRCPNIVGIKDSAGDLEVLLGFVGVAKGKFQVLCGSDKLLLHALENGASASVSGIANVFPEILVSVFQAFWSDDPDLLRRQVERLLEVRRALGSGPYLSVLKHALRVRGLRGGPVRPPLPELPAEAKAGIRARLDEIGLSQEALGKWRPQAPGERHSTRIHQHRSAQGNAV